MPLSASSCHICRWTCLTYLLSDLCVSVLLDREDHEAKDTTPVSTQGTAAILGPSTEPSTREGLRQHLPNGSTDGGKHHPTTSL